MIRRPPRSTLFLYPTLFRPPTVTTTVPVVAPAGTGTRRLVADQLVAVADVPLKSAELAPEVPPNLNPAIRTPLPTEHLGRDRLVMGGGTPTVNDAPSLPRPP